MFRKLLTFLLAGSLLCMTGCKKEEAPQEPAASETPAEHEETIGIWFSYIEYRDLCAGMNEEEFTEFTRQAVSNMKEVGVNTLYLHTVAFTDAFYDSEIYPKSSVISGMDYDPFKIFAESAKAADISVHAWINPMRSVLVSEAESLPQDFIIRKWIESNDERVRQNGDRYYLNPAYPEVRSLICSVVQELLEKYQPDGIHMDDYFYPYGTERSFDAYIFSRAQEENESLTLEDFRMNNTDTMVKQIHDTVKAYDPKIEFGISPAGNIDNCITLLYANPYHWVEQGTVDYLIPQIYWGYLHPIKPFEPTFEEWKGVTGDSNVRLLVGLAAYVIGLRMNLSENNESINNEWVEHDDMMARQMETVFSGGGDGVVYFSYSSFFAPDEETLEIVENEIIHIKNFLETRG